MLLRTKIAPKLNARLGKRNHLCKNLIGWSPLPPWENIKSLKKTRGSLRTSPSGKDKLILHNLIFCIIPKSYTESTT